MSCERCQKPIGSQSLQVGDDASKKWHPDCFRCNACTGVISGSFLVIDGMPHCQSCGHTCSACNQTIAPPNPESIEIDGIEVHASCFVCKRCSMQLKGVPFVGSFPDVHCSNCADAINEASAPSCLRCSQKILDAGVKLNSGAFHKSCCTCSECGADVMGGYVPADNGRLYCGSHASKAQGSAPAPASSQPVVTQSPVPASSQPAPAAAPDNSEADRQREAERKQAAEKKEAERAEAQRKEEQQAADDKSQAAKKKKEDDERKKREDDERKKKEEEAEKRLADEQAKKEADAEPDASDARPVGADIAELDALIASFEI